MAELSEKRYITRVGLSMFVMLLVSFLAQNGAALLINDYITPENQYWIVYGSVFLPQYLIAMPLAYLVLRGVPKAQLNEKKLGAARLFKVLLVCYAIMYAGSLIALIITQIINALANVQMADLVGEMVKGSDTLPNIIFVGLAAPVAEELFYRSMLITRLKRYGDKTAVIMSGLIFGLVHGNISQFFYAFGLGLALGYIFLRTGKIAYTIALHIIINIMGGVIAPLIVNYYSNTALAMLYSVAILSMAIAGLVLFITNKKRIWFGTAEGALENWKKAFFLNEGIALFLIACAAQFVVNTIYALAPRVS